MPATDATEQQFDDTPTGKYARWKMEMDAARKELSPWHKRAEKVVKRFIDDREGDADKKKTRWNLFTASVQTQRDMLYGKMPQVSVGRRFEDAQDDTARVAGEMLERLLNTDIQCDSDSYASALRYSLLDWLLTDFGNMRVCYEADFEEGEETPAQYRTNEAGEQEEAAPAVPAVDKLSREDVEIEYVHWRDQLWSPARTFGEVRWWGFRCQMSREALVKRFGADVGRKVPLNAKRGEEGGADTADAQRADPWQRAEVWEIWDKEHERVCWYVEGFARLLDEKEDPYELEGFWPFPRPLIANATTSALVPVPDFSLAQDLYQEIDDVSDRITTLEKAVVVKGLYNRAAGQTVERLVNGASQNQLIPVENWAAFAEGGGVKGQIDWLPLEMVVAALDKLRDYRNELIQALYQVTGMSDIMRGQATDAATTATEQSIKARFASVRMQARQDEFARFASDVQKLKAELISKRFAPETILERSNAAHMFQGDQQLAMQAVQLIKEKFPSYRIEVKPEAVSLTDFAALKAERMEVLQAMTGFIQAVAPVAQQMPGATPFLLQLLQWTLSGLRGASTAEGIIDQAIVAAQQAAQQQAQQPQMQPPDPKLLTTQMKAQADAQKMQMQAQNDALHMQMETQQLAQRQQTSAQLDIQKQAVIQKMKAQHAAVTPLAGPGGGLP